MTTYYARHSSGQNFGVYLDVWRLETTADMVNVGVSGGHHSYAGSWYFTAYASLSYYENSGHDWENGNYSISGSGDKQWFSATDYFWRREYDRSINLYCYEEATVNGQYGTAKANVWITVPHLPDAPTNLNATYVSDNQINLSWNAPTRGYEAMCLEVSIDGGSWSEFSVLWNSSTSTSFTQASADHTYKFRARTYYKLAYSSYTSETAAITTTPVAPSSITLERQTGTDVLVTVVNNSTVATSLEWQESTDGGTTWTDGSNSPVIGSPVTSFVGMVSGGTVTLRVRNVNSMGESAWLVSDPIVTITPPNPPTLVSPANGGILNTADGSVTFGWKHNPLDGSSQTAAQLAYSTNGGSTWITVTKSTEQSHTISPIPWAVGTLVTWRVRTKGADANFSEWSQTGAFNVYTAPTLSITSPGATITGMPINLTATYSDMAGFTCQAATVRLTKDGRTLYSEAATINGTSITSSLDVSEFLPTNGETYTVVLTARSSSSLQTTVNASFLVDFTEPQAGELQITNDPDTGYASLLATFDNHASEQTYSGATNEQYESAEGYVRSLTVEGKSEAHSSPNLYDPSESVSGYLVAGGSIQPAGSVTNERTSDFIPVTAGESYVFQVWVTPPKSTSHYLWMAYILYDSDKSAVGQRQSKTAGADTGTPQHASFIIEIPSGISYIRLSARMYDGGRMMLEQGETESAYQPFPYIASIESAGVRGRNLLRVDSDLTQITSGAFSNTTPRSFSEGQVWVGITSNNYFARNNITSYTISDGSATFTTTTNGYGLGFPVRVSAGTAVTLSWGGGGAIKFGYFTAGGEYISSLGAESTSQITETMPANTGWLLVVLKPAANKETTYTDMMLELGSTAHPYVPYSVTTITTTIRSAGSVHDTLTADADSWTVERRVGVVDLGTLTWTSPTTGIYYGSTVPNMKKGAWNNNNPNNCMVTGYTTLATKQVYEHPENDMSVALWDTEGRVGLRNNTITDAAALKTSLSGVYMFYELATPTQDTETSMSRIEIGSAFTVATDLDSTFEMTTWDGSADAVSISVSRMNADGTITPLLTDGASGSGLVDRYAPLNTPYQYAVTTTAASKAVRTVYVDAIINTRKWFAYSGNIIAAADYTTGGTNHSYSRPNRVRVHYVGRKNPVSYDDGSVDFSVDTTFFTIDKAQADAFERIMENDARGIVKTGDGLVYHADFELSTSNTLERHYSGKVVFKAHRIEGERL